MTPSSSPPPHEGKKKSGKWKKLASKYVYKNPWIKVREDRVIQPDGKEGIYGVVEQNKGVSVVPVDADGMIWMVKVYRYIFDDAHWELVAGDVEEHETHTEGAARELEEELGLRADRWDRLGSFRASNGRLDQTTEVFLAQGLKRASQLIKDIDVLEQAAFSLEQIEEMIRQGEIVDGYVMNALYFYKLHTGL